MTGPYLSVKKRSISRKLAAVALICGIAAFATLSLRLHAQAPQAPLPDSAQVLAFLNRTITWYRQQNPEALVTDDQNQLGAAAEQRHLADQILALSFEFARAEARLLASQAQANGQPLTGMSERYREIARRTEGQVQDKQRELDALKQKVAAASGPARVQLQAAMDRTASDLELTKTVAEALRGLVQYAAESSSGSGHDLNADIDQLERTVPQAQLMASKAAGASQTSASAPASTVAAAPVHKTPSSILGIASELFELRRNKRATERAMQLSDELLKSSREVGLPLTARLRDSFRRGDELGNQPATSDPAVLREQKKQIDALNELFKRVSSASMPLSRQRILIQAYGARLVQTRGAIDSQRSAEWNRLVWRLIGLVLVLALALTISEFWRRATFRYIQDARRRAQFLLLRKVVMLLVIALIIALSLATDISSLTTFAGLLTAGIAIALQNVILSFVGYFVLIGKYGIRVGDRLQISRVTGKVAEIGLVRLYLIEMSGTGSDLFPTGRIVEFPNSVVFDANAGIFKQLPGTQFIWHEVTTMLPRDADYRAMERKMLGTVNTIFADYSAAIERQHHEMERTLKLRMEPPRPQSRFRLSPAGIEVTIRYPVELEQAAEIDDRVTRGLLQLMDSNGRATKA